MIAKYGESCSTLITEKLEMLRCEDPRLSKDPCRPLVLEYRICYAGFVNATLVSALCSPEKRACWSHFLAHNLLEPAECGETDLSGQSSTSDGEAACRATATIRPRGKPDYREPVLKLELAPSSRGA